MTAAAPPPAATLERVERAGFHVTHAYGLTETYGPAVSCAWHEEWNSLSADEQAKKKSRQGVSYHVLQGLTVMDPDTGEFFRVLNCRNLHNGKCKEYWLRPRLCRAWPEPTYVMPPILFSGCGYRAIDRQADAETDFQAAARDVVDAERLPGQ